ncbi:CrcB family protein [Fructobacillus sp. M1-13]|uniref:Fluoride-specific ion channel FluC n=1 Tax=Fructobacillus papyriferae TaxID=2713171 RepID=A0ABS5QRX2_9LACO|nr:CrcB family protein [Fructobacillus papyriferae]MBS9335146.1 CrcB family protein [Fructobacillus papyriferae]MCD2159184.1 CrcB family protein [Fructobacillus papyriferae]
MSEEKLPVTLLAVFLGGCLGGAFRYLLGLLPGIGAWPLVTVFINTVGTGCLASLAAYMKQRKDGLAYVQSFLGTGLLGGFTTFGALILELDTLFVNRLFSSFFLLLAASLLLAFFSIWVGKKVGYLLARKTTGGHRHG